jgi:hypothetical protein
MAGLLGKIKSTSIVKRTLRDTENTETRCANPQVCGFWRYPDFWSKGTTTVPREILLRAQAGFQAFLTNFLQRQS